MSENRHRAQQQNKYNNMCMKPSYKHRRTKKWYGTEDPSTLPPFSWIEGAKIFNHRYEKVPIEWLLDSADILVLYFSMRNSDRKDNIMTKFYEFYENARFKNLPIEVINVPLDETKEDMCISYDEQANWFTLMFDDPTITTLRYRHQITAVPHLVVIRTDGSLVSTHGILDLDEFGRNALIAWLSLTGYTKIPKKINPESKIYGPKWSYLNAGVGKVKKPEYKRYFTMLDKVPSIPVVDGKVLVERPLKAEEEQKQEDTK